MTRIRNWHKFQHFKDRRPPWIKLYRDILDDLDWHELSGDDAKALVMLWLIASEADGALPNTQRLAFRLRTSKVKVEQILTRLSHWLDHDDINVISGRYQSDTPETEKSFLSSSPTSSLGLEEIEEEQACGKNGAAFAEFWLKYPNKVGKMDAKKKFDEAMKVVSFESLMNGLRLYQNKADDRPWCNPATWLHQGRWDDQPAQQQPRGGVLGALDKIQRNIENGFDSEASEDTSRGLPPQRMG